MYQNLYMCSYSGLCYFNRLGNVHKRERKSPEIYKDVPRVEEHEENVDKIVVGVLGTAKNSNFKLILNQFEILVEISEMICRYS